MSEKQIKSIEDILATPPELRTWQESIRILQLPIPREMLKPISGKGGGNLSTVHTGYAHHRMDQAFGPGLWSLERDVERSSWQLLKGLEKRVKNKSRGNDPNSPEYVSYQVDEFIAVATCRFVFSVHDVPGFVKPSADVSPYRNGALWLEGSHQGSDLGDAIKGSVTSAFMQLMKSLGFGKEIYSDLYSNAVSDYTMPFPKLREGLCPLHIENQIKGALTGDALNAVYVKNRNVWKPDVRFNTLLKEQSTKIKTLAERAANGVDKQPAAPASNTTDQ